MHTFYLLRIFTSVISTYHVEVQLFGCQFCDQAFYTSAELREHAKSHISFQVCLSIYFYFHTFRLFLLLVIGKTRKDLSLIKEL